MAPVSAHDHEIILVTPEMTELRQQCYDIRVAVFVSEQGKLLLDFNSLSSSYNSGQVSQSRTNLTSDCYK